MLSFETAKRLREAGFPQPETVEDGQFWYSCGQRLWFIQTPHKMGIAPEKWFGCYPYFAPTAADIMRQLSDAHFYIGAEGNGFSCDIRIYEARLSVIRTIVGEDLDEVAAEAWFKKQKAKIDAIIAG